MHIHVRDHAAFHELLFDKLAGELDARCWFSSRGIENSTSRANCASLRFSAPSTSFHKVARPFQRSGAPSGSMIPARQSVVSGKSVSVRVDLGGRRHLKTK